MDLYEFRLKISGIQPENSQLSKKNDIIFTMLIVQFITKLYFTIKKIVLLRTDEGLSVT